MSNKYKNILSVIAILLASVLTLGLAFGLCYSAGLFGSDKVIENSNGDDFEASSVILGDGTSSGIQLLSKTLYDEGSDITTKDNSATYSIEATITPANTSDQNVTMSVAWADSSSDWATGKKVSDYVTITQDSTGSLTGTLACTAAFGEQVVLTVALDSDSTVYATATIDYVARIVEYNVIEDFYSWGNVLTNGYAFGNYLFCDNSTSKLVYGIGTIYGEFTEATVYLDLVNDDEYSDGFLFGFLNTYVKPYAEANGLSIADFAAIELGTLADGAIDSSGNLMLGASESGYKQIVAAETFMDFVAAMIPEATQTQLNEFESTYLNTIISDYLELCDNKQYCRLLITVDYTYSYNGTVYSSGKIVASGGDLYGYELTVNGTGVLLNGSSFVF